MWSVLAIWTSPPDGGLASSVGPVAYLAVLLLLFPFGLHRLYLVWLRLRASSGEGRSAGPGRGRGPSGARASGAVGAGARPGGDGPGAAEDDPGAAEDGPRGAGGGGPGDLPPDPCPDDGGLPAVTVQIPVYNEAAVVGRAVDAACRLDWPRDRLEVQVLDDSTDETSRIAARRAERWRERGVDVRHLRREGREGYKAGALAAGTARARGDLFLVLDADFVPPPHLLRRLVPSFRDPEVGFVQAAWSHLNEDESWLTRGQALLLDGHFAVEHAARHRNGLFFNFNGTAGMWRRACLEDVGGWSGETLTEDLELSYRAQMAGWRGVYRDDVRVPGELPPDLRALEVQQERWTRGGIQTARRVLPEVWGSGLALPVKLEATAHLAGHVLHPLTLLLGLALAWPGRLGGMAATVPGWVHAAAVSLAVVPFLLHYAVAAGLRGRGPAGSVPRIACAVALGIGLGPPLTAAALRGLRDRRSGTFRRTPKAGDAPGGGVLDRYGLPARPVRTAVRAALGLLLAAASVRLGMAGEAASVLFTGLFAAGYLATAVAGLTAGLAGDPGGHPPDPAPRPRRRDAPSDARRRRKGRWTRRRRLQGSGHRPVAR